MNPARLLFPALRWREDAGFDHVQARARAWLELGVGGFIVFGGDAAAVAGFLEELRGAAGRPLLFAADLERGAGQQFRGCTSLPPAAALGSLDDLETVWRAGELTAREARALGIGWIYAPVADLGGEPRNPIVGTRAFGADPRAVARQVAAWVSGCRAGGAMACAKHFPGHGRTVEDSHLALPRVEGGPEELATDLVPFAAAVEAGVGSVMTGHVAYPGLDPGGLPATRSALLVRGLLRGRLGFDGIVVSDALVMEGVRKDGGEGHAAEAEIAVEAVSAGVDALLYPEDPEAVARGLRAALDRGVVDEVRVREAAGRIGRTARGLDGPSGGSWGREEDREWTASVATRSVRLLRMGSGLPSRPRKVELRILDDDHGGSFAPPPRSTLREALSHVGIEIAREAPRRWVAVFSDPRAAKGRAGLSADTERRVAAATGAELLLLFGHPRLAEDLPSRLPTLCAWGGEPLMQRAAALAVDDLLSG